MVIFNPRGADSGGVGDFIRHGIEFLKEEGARDESVINSDSEHARVLSAIVKIDTQKVQEWLHLVKIKTKNSDETRIWKENLQLILCQQDLINVYYHNSNESLEKSILRKVPQFFSPFHLSNSVWTFCPGMTIAQFPEFGCLLRLIRIDGNHEKCSYEQSHEK